MTKITTDFVGGETTAEDKARITAIAEWWLGSGALAAAATRGDVRTLLNTVCIPPITSGELCGSFYPKLNALNDPDTYIVNKLFGASEAGFLLNFDDLASLYQDTLAATPLTLPDQSVGLAADRSRARSPITVAAAVQASLGLRPKWGRMPKAGRRNKLYNSRKFAGGYWFPVDLTIADDAVTGPDGTLSASAMTITGPDSSVFQTVAVGTDPVTAAIWVKGIGASIGKDVRFWIWFAGTATGSNTMAYLTLTADWQRVPVTADPTTAGTLQVRLDPGYGGATSGDTIHVWNAQLEDGTVATADQVVGATGFDVTEAGLPSYGFIRPDLMDDYLTVTTPAAQTGDVMVFGRKGSWLETGVAYGSGAAVAIGPTTMTGLPAGLLQAVQGPVSDISGGLVGVLAIGRTLTAAERTAALNYYKARGAAGLLAAGAELVANGDFSDGAAGWSLSGAGVAVTGGKLTGVTNADSNAFAYFEAGVVAGNAYLLEWDVDATSDITTIYINNPSYTPAQSPQFSVALGRRRHVFIATSTGAAGFLVVGASGSSTGTFDNFSLKPLTVTP